MPRPHHRRRGRKNWKEVLAMRNQSIDSSSSYIGVVLWAFGILFFTIGVLNVFLVHPVPGVFYLLVSFAYFPPVNAILKERFGFTIPLVVRIILGLAIVWFTLGVSDLAEMLGF
jgi:hypothetical protein